MRFIPMRTSLFLASAALLCIASFARPAMTAEFDIHAVGQGIPDVTAQRPGRVLDFDELKTLLIRGGTEVGRIVNASRRDFADTGVVYKLNYRLTNEAEASGELDYSDGAFGPQGGHFILHPGGIGRRGEPGLCRAPAMQDTNNRCYVIYEIGENLYEARAASSELVRYRFRMIEIDAILAR